MRFVRSVSYVSGYRLLLSFDDGSRKMVDLEPELNGPVFEPLKDLGFFRQVRVDPDLDTIVWPNGADFAPEFLYGIGKSL